MSLIKHRFWALWLLSGSVVFSACTILPEPKSHDIYRLPPSTIGTGTGPSPDQSLRISRPASSDLLGSSRIAVAPDGHRLSAYEAVRWSSPASSLWRDHLLDAFHNDGRIARLSSDDELLKADIELGGMLRAFQTEYRADHPEVVIRLDAQLVKTRNRRILASRRFETNEAVHGDQVPEVVEAFGRASDKMAAEIIEWTMNELLKM